jgi:hypothetical protein
MTEKENILSPKEKAEEIFNSMKGFRVKHSHSAKCGLVAIRLVIESSPSLPILGDAGYYAEDIHLSTDYWKEVEIEFIKLYTKQK